MDDNLQHEDLLIKLRAKLNEQKVKLWEPPYVQPDGGLSDSFQNLAKKYSTELSLDEQTVLNALHELQIHSLDRSKANAEFKETGCATFRVKHSMPGEKPRIMKIQRKLEVQGIELIETVASNLGVTANRVKLINNGKVLKPNISLEEQGIKNGAQIMALVMAETPEEVKKEDTMYMEMKTTRDDATLLSEYIDELADDDEYMKLEDQSGKAVQLPPAEKRSLLVGLALHERGKAAAKQKDYPLALVLLLEADRQLSECSSSILKTVDNWAVLQLDISWCYLCLSNLTSAADANLRLQRAEAAFYETYGLNHERLIALKGSAANERALFMRLYLLQGIVAYHQNRRAEAATLLEKAENEMNALRVDENSVLALMELGWSRTQARGGLRAAGGDLNRAHHYLADKKAHRERERDAHHKERVQRLLGTCVDGSAVNEQLVSALVSMGFPRSVAGRALRNANNVVADAVRIIHDQPELLEDSEDSSEETESPSSEGSITEPDNKLVAELEAMGYETEEARTALRMSRNHISGAVDRLVAAGGHLNDGEDPSNPSTSTGTTANTKQKKLKKRVKDNKRKEREMALRRLKSSIRSEEDDYLDTSLVEEEEFLAQYKSLL